MKIFTNEEWRYLCDRINWRESYLDARAVRIFNKPENQEKDCDAD